MLSSRYTETKPKEVKMGIVATIIFFFALADQMQNLPM